MIGPAAKELSHVIAADRMDHLEKPPGPIGSITVTAGTSCCFGRLPPSS